MTDVVSQTSSSAGSLVSSDAIIVPAKASAAMTRVYVYQLMRKGLNELYKLLKNIDPEENPTAQPKGYADKMYFEDINGTMHTLIYHAKCCLDAARTSRKIKNEAEMSITKNERIFDRFNEMSAAQRGDHVSPDAYEQLLKIMKVVDDIGSPDTIDTKAAIDKIIKMKSTKLTAEPVDPAIKTRATHSYMDYIDNEDPEMIDHHRATFIHSQSRLAKVSIIDKDKTLSILRLFAKHNSINCAKQARVFVTAIFSCKETAAYICDPDIFEAARNLGFLDNDEAVLNNIDMLTAIERNTSKYTSSLDSIAMPLDVAAVYATARALRNYKYPDENIKQTHNLYMYEMLPKNNLGLYSQKEFLRRLDIYTDNVLTKLKGNSAVALTGSVITACAFKNQLERRFGYHPNSLELATDRQISNYFDHFYPCNPKYIAKHPSEFKSTAVIPGESDIDVLLMDQTGLPEAVIEENYKNIVGQIGNFVQIRRRGNAPGKAPSMPAEEFSIVRNDPKEVKRRLTGTLFRRGVEIFHTSEQRAGAIYRWHLSTVRAWHSMGSSITMVTPSLLLTAATGAVADSRIFFGNNQTTAPAVIEKNFIRGFRFTRRSLMSLGQKEIQGNRNYINATGLVSVNAAIYGTGFPHVSEAQ